MDMTSNGRGDAPKRKPGRIFYLLAALPAICGIVAMVVLLATKLPALDDGLEQIVVPGVRELQLEPGRHTVFLEYSSVVDGRVYRVEQVSGLTVRVDAADGAPVAVNAPMGSATYSLGGRQGEAINVFDVERAGAYRISANYGGAAGPQTVIAVGHGFMGTLFTTILSALGAAFMGMILAATVVVGVYMARRRARHG